MFLHKSFVSAVNILEKVDLFRQTGNGLFMAVPHADYFIESFVNHFRNGSDILMFF